ncbi:RDD family protein [Corynebacterium halotolerans]|uniref:RDD family protein n=1 Tax=Corynebacterium halotolerans TaxID=225326 RepID=UPI003CED9BC8
MDPNNVDLYTAFGLDPGDDTDSLRLLLNGRDAQLETQGVLPDHPQRQQLQTAYAVLGQEHTRREYDTAILQRRPLSWEDVRYLGNFGALPQVDPFTAHPQAAAPAGPINFNRGQPYAPSYPQSVPFPAVHSDRGSAGVRLAMVLIDGIILGIAAGIVGGVVGFSEALAYIGSFLVMVVYMLGFETKTGGTPAKHLLGYEVRDVKTGAKPSLEQSAKRSWWRLVTIVPGLGGLVSLVGMIAIGSSIKPENNYLGSHDRWSGTEVVKKQS